MLSVKSQEQEKKKNQPAHAHFILSPWLPSTSPLPLPPLPNHTLTPRHLPRLLLHTPKHPTLLHFSRTRLFRCTHLLHRGALVLCARWVAEGFLHGYRQVVRKGFSGVILSGGFEENKGKRGRGERGKRVIWVVSPCLGVPTASP